MNRPLKIACLMAFVMFSKIASPCRATVAFTTLTNSGTYDLAQGFNVQGTTQDGYASYAESFSPTIGGNLSSIDLGVSLPAGEGDGNFTISLDANNVSGGPLTTDVLASGNLVTTNETSGGSDSSLTSFDYTGPALSLSSGVTYWIVLTPSDTNTLVTWDFCEEDLTTPLYKSTNGGTSYSLVSQEDPYFAFEVNVTSVPEPSTCEMFAVGVGLLCFRYRRSPLGRLPRAALVPPSALGWLGTSLGPSK
jgi:hypothetical protein